MLRRATPNDSSASHLLNEQERYFVCIVAWRRMPDVVQVVVGVSLIYTGMVFLQMLDALRLMIHGCPLIGRVIVCFNHSQSLIGSVISNMVDLHHNYRSGHWFC
jgi:hypothetical protein